MPVSSVTQLCPTLCNPMDCSSPGLPVHHQLPEFTQTQVHWVSDAIQPSHPLGPFSSRLRSFPASGSFPVSWLFASGAQTTGASASASVLPINIQGWFPLGLTALISLLSKGISRVFSNTSSETSILWLSAFFMIYLSHPYITTVFCYCYCNKHHTLSGLKLHKSIPFWFLRSPMWVSLG